MQVRVAGESHRAFLPEIDNADAMNEAQLNKALKRAAQEQRQETTTILAELAREKFTGKCMKEKRANTKANLKDEEKYWGEVIPNPVEAVPAYLEAKEVQEMDIKICTAAQENRVVTSNELSDIVNHLLVRLSIKNGLRKQVLSHRTF